MPSTNERSITINKVRADRWKYVAMSLGYGSHGRQKLLDFLLDYAEQNPVIFRKR